MNAFEYRPWEYRGWSLFKEDNYQIITEVKSFNKIKVLKSYRSLNLL